MERVASASEVPGECHDGELYSFSATAPPDAGDEGGVSGTVLSARDLVDPQVVAASERLVPISVQGVPWAPPAPTDSVPSSIVEQANQAPADMQPRAGEPESTAGRGTPLPSPRTGGGMVPSPLRTRRRWGSHHRCPSRRPSSRGDRASSQSPPRRLWSSWVAASSLPPAAALLMGALPSPGRLRIPAAMGRRRSRFPGSGSLRRPRQRRRRTGRRRQRPRISRWSGHPLPQQTRQLRTTRVRP